ncbi:MAG: Sensor protein [uncultured bacterium]|nr:MAG: Sensor protein [uncultured bacterium]
MTISKQKKELHASVLPDINQIEDELYTASVKRLAEYSYEKVTDEGLDLSNIHFNDLFDIDDIQHIQDAFASATGVAAIITDPSGLPITKPSNFTPLCINIIRQTELGLKNCMRSDAQIGRYNPKGAVVQPCLSGGLWDAGASISIGKNHIANWLIGQIRDQSKSDEEMLEYAIKIGADPKKFSLALKNIPVMAIERFQDIANALFLIANMMSNAAYQNLKLASVVTQQKVIEKELLQYKEKLEELIEERTNQVVKLNTKLEKNLSFLNRLVDTSPNLVFSLNPQDEITFCNDQFIHEFGVSEKKAVIGKKLCAVFKGMDQGFCNGLLEINHNGIRTGQYECVLQLNLGQKKQYLANKATLVSSDNLPQENIFILINLTKQKNQEMKLSNSEHRLLTLFESMPVILLEEDQSEVKAFVDDLKEKHGDGAIEYFRAHPELLPDIHKLIRITDCNQMALEFYGFPTKDELFKDYLKLFSTSASESFKKQIEGYILGKTEFESEDPHYRSTGEQVFVRVRLSIPQENLNDFRRVLVSIVDITERKNAENALAYNEEKFRNVIQQSVDGIILFDQNGKIIEWNRADERITGYSIKEAQAMHIWDLISILTKDTKEIEFLKIHDQLKAALFDRMSPLLNDIMEITITAKNGDRLVIAATLSNIETGHNFVGCLIIRDLSNLKKSQAEVQKLASAVREISEGLVIANLRGETEYVNLAVEKITGFSSEELLGKNLLHFLTASLSVEQINFNELGLQAGNIQRGKMVCTKKDGTQYTLQYNIAPIVDEHGNRNYVSVISDVSQNELMEQQNRQAQKLEAIGSLAAGVAHEINTPTQYVGNNLLFIKKEFNSFIRLLEKFQQLLNQVQSGESVNELTEQLLLEKKEADLDYLMLEIPKAIDESLEGIGRVTKIVQAIKEFSHPSMDEKTPVDLNRAIDTTITVSRNEWKYVADLVPHYDENLPTVICSPGEINQVILNLITNAAHAIKEQIAKGVFTKGLIEIFTFSKEKSIEIHVKDNGGGIPDEYREKVFNPFFTTKPVGMGTGQGLSISYKVIVNKHNGSLVFNSEDGKGTTFIITLPIIAGEKTDLVND